MALEKNQEYEMTIEDMGNDGEGIGHVDGMAVFVKDAIVGDVARVKIIKTKKKYAYGRLMELVESSPFRIRPICPLARRCGGCSVMHMDYKKQLEWKQDKVMNCLKRIGGIEEVEEKMEPVIGMEFAEAGKNAERSVIGESKSGQEYFPAIRYRNKAQFPVQRDKDGRIVIGFYAGRTHCVMDTDVCYLQAEVNDEIIKRIRAFLETYEVAPYNEEQHTGLIRHILTRVGRKTGEVMVCLIINGTELVGERMPEDTDKGQGVSNTEIGNHVQGEKLSAKNESRKKAGKRFWNVERQFVECMKDIPGMTSISLNVNTEKTNRVLGDTCRTIWGKDFITDYIGSVKYQISPLSFYQVNPEQTEKLYRKALEYADLTGKETVWDLYCGIGTISLFLAQRAKKVFGVEIVPEAIADARQNAQINGITNVEFFVGKAEEILPEQYEKYGVYADVIVVDPPRKGCDEVVIGTMIQMAPKRIVYVSCDAATLARDVKMLAAAGYEVEKVCAVDQFGHSGHVETVVQLVNIGVKPDYTVRIDVDVDEMYRVIGEDKRNYIHSDEYKKIKESWDKKK